MDDSTDLSAHPDADLAPPPPPPPPPPPRRRSVLGRRGATAALASGLVIGGIAGGYVITEAATATPSATTTPATTPGPSTGTPALPGHPGGDCSGGGPASRAEDQQVVATAIGISTTQLQTEETAGKTIAAIATEHHVAVSKVVSALVASENAEIDQRVSSGQITAAQGAQQKSTTTQRVAAEVNGTRPPAGSPDGGPPAQR